MLHHPTFEKLKTLKFTGMVTALNEQLNTPDITELSFEERLGLLVVREITVRKIVVLPIDCNASRSNTMQL